MRCATCGSRELAVEITFRGMVACRFDHAGEFEMLQPPELESRWSDESQVVCLHCAWRGTVLEAGSTRGPQAAAERSPRKPRRERARLTR